MILSLIAASIFGSALQTAKPVSLYRISHAGEKLAYDVKSHLQIEFRAIGLQTWIPEDLDLNYAFTTQVIKLKPDGIVDLSYQRPTLTEIKGETSDAPPKETVIKQNLDFLLTVTPLNQIVAQKDQAKKAASDHASERSFGAFGPAAAVGVQGSMQAMLAQFVREIYQLALNTGSFDSALDFAPKLPVDDVKPGDTWKTTVGYSPQKLAGTVNKSAVQRLDYTYTYEGIVESKGRKVHRVSATLNLNTDLADFFHQSLGAKPEETGVRSIKLNLKTKIDFDLDLDTKQTIRAVSQSEGGFSFVVTDYPNQPIQEENIKGRTIMNLVGRA